MILQPIVEGQGEEKAVPVLLRRLVGSAQAWDIQIARPHRRKRSQLVDESQLRKAVQVAKLTPDCGAILVILDADDDCPKELAPRLAAWATDEARPLPCEVVLANREYEAWLLAGVAPLKGHHRVRPDAPFHDEPESPRDAKGQIESLLMPGTTYMPTVDQAPLTAGFDLADAFRACRSFRKLTKSFGVVLDAAHARPESWPPADWTNK